MKLHCFSDLHLEFGPLQRPRAEADVVIAAGDIGVGLEGIRWLAGFDKPVIYVLGNHEYWGRDYTDFIDEVWRESGNGNTHLLENESVVIDGVRFVGCSLWADYANGDQQVMEAAFHGMNDFRHITDNGGPLRPRRLLETHRQSVQWLWHVLAEPHDGPTVVVTHHAPSMKSWHRGPLDGYMYCYCTDLEGLIHRAAPKLWVHGHTHSTRDYHVGPTRVVCNPRGYHNYEEVAGFDPLKIIEV